MSWEKTIIAAHTAVTNQVSHSRRMKSNRYFVWQEESGNDLAADGLHAERAMRGHTDLFTKKEFDPWARALEDSFTASEISWELRDVQYEEDTGFWHYTWDWEVLDGAD